MSDLQNQTPADTYKGLLQVGDYTDGITNNTGATALQVTDGAGVNTALALSTNRVGVGNNSPQAELDVSGNVVADEYALDQTGSSSSAVAIHTPAPNELAIRTNSTEAMRIDSDGNVGIGTASPDQMLHISGTSPIIKLTDTNTSLSSLLLADTGMGSLIFASDVTDGGTNPFISFRIEGAADADEKMRITSDGNVGVGTTNPVSALEVTANSTESAFRGTSPDGLSTIDIKKTNSGDTEFSNSLYVGGTSGDFSFTNGNVGIGTVSPSAPLEVASTTGGVIMPRMTTTERNNISSPTDGEMIYNTTTNKFQGRANGAWVDFH